MGPFSANSKKCLRCSMARELVLLRSIIDESKLLNTTTSVVALVIATFSLLSPPLLFSGPKFMLMVLASGSVGPYAKLSIIMSLSSPWTDSRFFTNTGSLSGPSWKYCSMFGCCLLASSSKSSMVLCWSVFSVTTPIDLSLSFLSRSLRTISATTAFASPVLLRPLPLA